MKEFEIAEAFRTAFAADAVFAGRACLNDQTAGAITRPCLIFAVNAKPINGTGTALTYTLTVWVETEALKGATPPSEEAHAAAGDLVEAKLNGAGKPALLTALNAGGGFDFRGWNAADGESGLSTEHFRDSTVVTGCVLVL